MKFAFPVVLTPFENGEHGYTATMPDLPGVVSEGSSVAEALLMAQDAAAGWVYEALKDGERIPKASTVAEIQRTLELHAHESHAQVNITAFDVDAYARQWGHKSVRKNITIPAYLDALAKAQHVNYSAVLRGALENLLVRQ